MSHWGGVLLVLAGLAVALGPPAALLSSWDAYALGKYRLAIRHARWGLLGSLGPYAFLFAMVLMQAAARPGPFDTDALLGVLTAGGWSAMVPVLALYLLTFLGSWWVLRRAERDLEREERRE